MPHVTLQRASVHVVLELGGGDAIAAPQGILVPASIHTRLASSASATGSRPGGVVLMMGGTRLKWGTSFQPKRNWRDLHHLESSPMVQGKCPSPSPSPSPSHPSSSP